MKIYLRVLIVIGSAQLANGAYEPKQKIRDRNFYSNIPIRVLLHQSPKGVVRTAHVVESLNLLGKQPLDKDWKSLPSLTTVNVEKGKETLIVNGDPVVDKHFYIRAGSAVDSILKWNNQAVRGVLRFSVRGGKLFVTNVLPLEIYLAGGLAAEMNASWNLEALKAQAVASRTYAIYMKEHPKDELYDLEPTIKDQVYVGVEKENPKVWEALENTAGSFLADSNGKAIKSFYHSRCGGFTETAEEVWGTSKFTKHDRVKCPYCQKNPFHWSTNVPYNEAIKLLGLGQTDPTPPRLLAAKESSSGRLLELEILSSGKRKKMKADEFRSTFGYQKVRSSLFEWTETQGGFQIEGTGLGHGVGMCQWGAQYLAKKGKTFLEILNHYYPKYKILKIGNKFGF